MKWKVLLSNFVNLIHKNDFGDWNFILTAFSPQGISQSNPGWNLRLSYFNPPITKIPTVCQLSSLEVTFENNLDSEIPPVNLLGTL